MNPSPTPTFGTPETPDLNARILTAVIASRWKSRLLATVALTFGFLSIVASLAVVASYFVVYRPKEKQILVDWRALHQADAAKTGSGEELVTEETLRRRLAPLEIAVGNTIAMAFCIALIAAAVALLSGGTLVTLTLVLWHRRVSLRQLNESLEQIAQRLANLQATGLVKTEANGPLRDQESIAAPTAPQKGAETEASWER
jgi:hypothetical protein